MTTSLLITTMLASGVLSAHLGRAMVQLGLSYLALQGSKPTERKQILEALAPALDAVGPAGSRQAVRR
ncbi:MAG: hypothetical protein ACRDSN_20200, partial [Pseudonocardiaceae bacterium]